MRTRTAIVNLLRDSAEWRQFFKQCCATSPLRLCSQARQWRDELADRGNVFSTADVEDALMILARKVFPDGPASQWDTEWAYELCRDALARIGEHYSGLSEVERDALNLSVQDPYEERMVAAGEDNDPVAFREALRGWEQASLEALDKARARVGAA